MVLLSRTRLSKSKTRLVYNFAKNRIRHFAGLKETQAEFAARTIAKDMFTPRTVHKFTGHINGAIYGCPDKVKDGRTHLDNLFIAGTDQGFLGIIGAMLSGISMTNLHCLQSKE